MMTTPIRAKPLYKEEGEVEEDLCTGTRLISLSAAYKGPPSKPVITPIYHSTTYYANSCRQFSNQANSGYVYSRMKTANSDELEIAISQIERGVGTVLFSSGMGAIFNTLMCFLKPGDHIVVHTPLYSGSSYVLRNFFSSYNIEFSYVDVTSGVEGYRNATKKNTTVYYGETICNPMMRYLDVQKLGELAKEKGILTIVDGTFSTPINSTPLTHGIDIMVHSCTKYMSGHSDLLAGCATVNKMEHYSKLKTWQMFTGNCLSAFDTTFLMRSMRTLHIRVQKHNENAIEIAEYLEQHPKVKQVHYLGLPSHPQHELASTTMNGFGGMISFEVYDYEDSIKFAEATKVFKLAVSLGGVESLIEHVTSMTHGEGLTTEVERKGIPDTLIRLSVGIESVKDQIKDLEYAFSKISGK